MSIDYSALLTDEQKRNILEQRIAQFAAEAYQHELNKKAGKNIGVEDQAEAADKALALLESAINTYQSELDSLPKE